MKTGRRYEWDQKQYEAEHPLHKNGWLRYGPHKYLYEKCGVNAPIIAKGQATVLPWHHMTREFRNEVGRAWFPAYRKIDLNQGRNGYPNGKVGNKKGQVQVAFREPIRTKGYEKELKGLRVVNINLNKKRGTGLRREGVL